MYQLHDHHMMDIGPFSSNEYATATSTVENTTTIVFGNRIISATVVELTPTLLSFGEAASLQNNSEEDRDEDQVAAPMNDEGITSEFVQEVPVVMEEQMLLAGNGLHEEQIEENMRTKQYSGTTTNSECCICWEEYKEGETIGILDCAFEHEFHNHCIKTWLVQRNSCPLCRMDGLIIL